MSAAGKGVPECSEPQPLLQEDRNEKAGVCVGTLTHRRVDAGCPADAGQAPRGLFGHFSKNVGLGVPRARGGPVTTLLSRRPTGSVGEGSCALSHAPTDRPNRPLCHSLQFCMFTMGSGQVAASTGPQQPLDQVK